jgi:hypothetical protein
MKNSLLALAFVSVALLASCSQEVGTDGGDAPIADNTLRLSVDVADRLGQIDTRVAALDEEKTIESLYLLFFEPGATGNYVDFVEIADLQGMNVEHDINMSGTLLNVTDPYDILAIANVDGDGERYLNNMPFSSWVQQWAGKTKAEVIAEAMAWTTNAAVAPSGLLMSGMASKGANSFMVNLSLVRNQIRFDVVNNTGDYSLKSVAIYNAYPASKIWNDGSAEGTPDYSDSASRMETYYGFADAALEACFDDNASKEEVRGYLYAFENQVTMPVQNDRLTTALIVGLDGPSGTSYYRVNIAPEDMPQLLKRNYSYILSINSVVGEGRPSAVEAYDHPEDEGLNYVINNWDIPEVGVSDQDASSLLASPYQTINIDLFTGNINGRVERGLDGRSFDITTITSNPSPVSGLAIIGEPEFFLNGTEGYKGIEVALNGNSLEFTKVDVAPATPTAGSLKSGDKITGTITLGYAGLRITMNVLQTDVISEFLNLYEPGDGVPLFASFADIESGLIRVESSGPWTATILSENGGFGFVESASMEFKGDNGDTFSVKTTSNNPDANHAREAVVVVALDSDPVNVSDIVRLTQQQKAEVAITPNQTVTFDGTYDASDMSDGMAGNLASVPNNTLNKFDVISGGTGAGDATTINEWFYRIEAFNPANGAWEVVYNEDGNEVVDAARNWFAITAVHNTTVGLENSVTVDVIGKNTSGSNHRARIAVYLAEGGGPDSPGTAKAYLEIVQNTSSITLSPNKVPAVAKIGGDSQLVSVQADASLNWEIRGFEITNADRLAHHDVVLVDQDGTPIGLNEAHPVVGDGFKVRFPKIYYPNREIPIEAVVTVGIVGSELETEMTITQTTLTPNSFNVYGLTGDGYTYGQIEDTYNRGWDGNSGTWGIHQIPGYRSMGYSSVYTEATINPSVNYLHATMHLNGTHGDNYTWNTIKNYMDGRDAWTIFQAQAVDGTDAFNNSNSPFRDADYPPVQYGNDRNGTIDTKDSDTKIYQFLVDKGHHEITESLTAGDNYLYIDGINTYMNKNQLPESAVVLVSKYTGGENTPIGDEAVFVIDIENKFIWIGESQLFWYAYWLRNTWQLLDNIMYFVGNASKYGSHFTDMFLEADVPEDKQTPEVDGGRYAQPAPWDEYWGANAGVPSK